MTWKRLADFKEANPIEVADYAMTKGIHREPAFSWWVPYTLKKRWSIISVVNNRYLKKTHKLGIRISKSVKEADMIDLENGDSLWGDAIRKEMNAVKIAFRVLEGYETVPIGHQMIDCHLIFDVGRHVM